VSAHAYFSASLLFKLAVSSAVVWWVFGTLYANRPRGSRVEHWSGWASFVGAVSTCVFLVAAVLS
jgi:hypothetical protein